MKNRENKAMHVNERVRWFRWIAFAALLLALAGCGGGVDTVANPGGGGSSVVASYSGPAPATADVQAFKLNVWDNLSAANRCGSCHGTGGQTPMFVRGDDVNLAYADANSLVDLEQPALSRLSTKVGEGHNCWLASAGACADVITAYIEAWAGGAASGGRAIQLVAPPEHDPGASKPFPADSGLFAATVWPLLTQFCADCHAPSAPTQQAPLFAAADVDAAYNAAKSKIDLGTPGNSRLVLKLSQGLHNCWSNCDSNAATMQAAIESMANQIESEDIDESLVYSKALRLTDGVVASGGSRYENDQIALYEFKTGEGNIAYDTSGVEPALNLTLSGNYSWVGGWGVAFAGGKAQGTTRDSAKLHQLITATNEYSIEAWTVPGNVVQEGPARIVSYSAGTTARNFTMGQTQFNYDFLHRSESTDGNGAPALSTADADQRLQATLQHVVMTFDPANGRRIYVNGVYTGDPDPAEGGLLGDWDDSFAFVLGNEASGDRPWEGALRLVAIHNRALTPDQIVQNFNAGVGEKFFLLFGVGDLVGVPQGYVMFEVSQFDSYGYLFHSPTFISLDPEAQPDGIAVAGMRIGINGKEAPIGQAFSMLDTEVTGELYSPSTGQLLSPLGAVIPLEQGPDFDEFFLTFERLGGHTHVVTPPAFIQPGPPPTLAPVSDIGLRTFDRINYTMATLTGVSPAQNDVRNTFETVKQQLPTVESIDGFLSAHQMAVAQLAIAYCSALVENSGARAAYFPGLNFSAAPATALADHGLVIDPLISRMVGADLDTQPDPADVTSELNALINRLLSCSTCGNNDTRTRAIVKASCAAVLGSAVMLVQ